MGQENGSYPMIIIRMDDRDRAKIRFAYSPLTELTLSYRLLVTGDKYRSFHHRWMAEAQRKLDGVHLPYMEAVVGYCYFVPDFMVPPVEGAGLRLQDQLKAMYDVPPHLIVRDIEHVAEMLGMTEEREHLIKDPHGALPCLIEEIWFYWNTLLAQHWTRISATLESDVLYRAKQLALHGVETVLGDLNDRIEYDRRGRLILHKREECAFAPLNGRGLQFYPTVFKPGFLWQVDDEWQPAIGYGARGAGVWYQPAKIDVDESIELTLGASKARVLTALQEPYTTSDLAHLLHLSAGAVSQQLSKLTQAGLVLSNRDGNRVYYRLSPRGVQLLEVFG